MTLSCICDFWLYGLTLRIVFISLFPFYASWHKRRTLFAARGRMSMIAYSKFSVGKFLRRRWILWNAQSPFRIRLFGIRLLLVLPSLFAGEFLWFFVLVWRIGIQCRGILRWCARHLSHSVTAKQVWHGAILVALGVSSLSLFSTRTHTHALLLSMNLTTANSDDI